MIGRKKIKESVYNSTSGDEDGIINLQQLWFSSKNSLSNVFVQARADLRRARLSQTSWRFHYQIFHHLMSMPTAMRVPVGKKWLARLERLFIGMNVTVPKRKRALLLHYAGPDVDEIFDTLQETGEESEYDTAVAKLNEYFNPQVNTTYEVYNFRQTKQKEGESLDSYHTRLREVKKTC